jgi:hypothetical protein
MLANAIREREHPKYNVATRLAAFDGLRRPFVVSHGWIPAFAGMTQVGWSADAVARDDGERGRQPN